MEKSALIIIDLQAGIKRIFKDAKPNSWDDLLSKNQALTHLFVEAGLPVYLTSVQPKIFPPALKQAFGRLLLEEDNPNIRKLIKSAPSAFDNLDCDLEAELKKLGIESLYITGVSTGNGVIKTARDGAILGYKVYVVEDASSDKSLAKHNEIIQIEVPKLGQVISAAGVR